MGSAVVANHALSCHRYGSLIHGSSGLAESPRTSNFKRTLFQRTGLLALPRHLNHKQRTLIRPAAATAGNDKDANDEALQMHHQDDSYLALFSGGKSMEHVNSLNKAFEKSVTLGVAMAAGWFGSQTMDAIAADEESVTTAVTEAVTEAATKTTPEWIAPSVLAFPVVSYVLFTLYRNKVNPNAKLTDWVFGLVAMAILGNLILIATVGVRLY